MVNCERCHREFPFQWKLDRHLARKFPCKERKGLNGTDKGLNGTDKGLNGTDKGLNGTDKGLDDTGNLKCVYCLKQFATKKTLKRHGDICIMKDDHIRKLEIQLNVNVKECDSNTCRFCNVVQTKMTRHLIRCKAKQEYKEKLERQLEERKPIVATTTNNITNNNIDDHSTNITNYITVNPFGKENMEYLTRAVILKLCCKANFRNEIIPRLVKQVHFNPEHPENHNILMTNLRAAYGKVYNGEDYIVETSRDIGDKVMDNVTDHLTTAAYTDNEDGKFNPYERAITRLEEDMGDEDSKFKREQRTKVKRNMYNNQRLIEKTVRKV